MPCLWPFYLQSFALTALLANCWILWHLTDLSGIGLDWEQTKACYWHSHMFTQFAFCTRTQENTKKHCFLQLSCISSSYLQSLLLRVWHTQNFHMLRFILEWSWLCPTPSEVHTPTLPSLQRLKRKAIQSARKHHYLSQSQCFDVAQSMTLM